MYILPFGLFEPNYTVNKIYNHPKRKKVCVCGGGDKTAKELHARQLKLMWGVE